MPNLSLQPRADRANRQVQASLIISRESHLERYRRICDHETSPLYPRSCAGCHGCVGCYRVTAVRRVSTERGTLPRRNAGRNEKEAPGMRLSRRTALAGATGVAAFGILHWYPADAAEFTYKVGHDLPAMFPMNLRLKQAATKIGEESGGRLVVQVYPNGQIGSDSQ